MYVEEDLLPISSLQHVLFCERRAALVFTEALWSENVFTAQGRVMHDKAHEIETEVRGSVRIARGLWLRSFRLGIVGKADVVEFHRLNEAGQDKNGVAIYGGNGLWRPVPIEYKRGRLRDEESYEVQLCAQALCLEEMLHVVVLSGAIFYGQTRRRMEIAFDEGLRKQTEDAAFRLHELISSGVTPPAYREPKCQFCSLNEICLPGATAPRHSAKGYIKRSITDLDGGL